MLRETVREERRQLTSRVDSDNDRVAHHWCEQQASSREHRPLRPASAPVMRRIARAPSHVLAYRGIVIMRGILSFACLGNTSRGRVLRISILFRSVRLSRIGAWGATSGGRLSARMSSARAP